MRLPLSQSPFALGGWGRLICQPPERGACSEDDRFAVDLSAEGLETAVRLERHRAASLEPTGQLARSHATLSFLDNGTYTLRRRQRVYLVDPLSVALFAPFAPFTISHPHGEQHRGLSVFLSDDLFFGALVSAVDRPWPAVVPGSLRSFVLEQIVRRVARQRDGVDKLEQACRALWRSVRSDLLSAGPAETVALRCATIERHELAVVRARVYLANHFDGPVALGDIARASFVSLYYLTRIFRLAAGTTLHGYLTRLRLRAALIGIADPRRLLDEVATSVGYVSHSHFTKVVRQHMGLVPSDLRQLILEADPDAPAFKQMTSQSAGKMQDWNKPLSF
jgi:AraC-like DNA-binding protein